MAEAVTLKHFTIPPGAYHPIDQGSNLHAVKLFELGDEVAAVFVDSRGDYLLATCCPCEGICRVVSPDFRFWQSQERAETAERTLNSESAVLKEEEIEKRALEKMERFELGVKFFLAVLIRDFWVVKDRQALFGSRRLVRRVSKLNSDRRNPVWIYLPRIRYQRDYHDHPDGLNLKVRKPHLVRGHLRKAVHASGSQLFLARRFGIVVPEGFTFVRGHRRGEVAAEAAYRSVSALRCIKALDSPQPGDQDDWFTFEINVRNWLERSGYAVEHIAGNKHGDGGVDIQARRDAEFLLVQCKHWSPDRAIQPNIVRELLGSLSTFPAGALGVIVTSSRLSAGARDLCEQQGIQYIESVNFQKDLNYRLGR